VWQLVVVQQQLDDHNDLESYPGHQADGRAKRR
jgi:hypothetical protein